MIEKILDSLNTDEYGWNYIIGKTDDGSTIMVPIDKVANPIFIWKNGNLQTGIMVNKPEYFMNSDRYKDLKEDNIESLIRFLKEENEYGINNYQFILELVKYIGGWDIIDLMPNYELLPKYERYYKAKHPCGGILSFDKEKTN